MELDQLNDKIDRVYSAVWERTKSLSNLLGDLTVRLQKIERSVESPSLASEVRELATRIGDIEKAIDQIKADTFISRSLSGYGDRLIDLFAQIVASRLDHRLINPLQQPPAAHNRTADRPGNPTRPPGQSEQSEQSAPIQQGSGGGPSISRDWVGP